MERSRRPLFAGDELRARVEILAKHAPLGSAIVSFWLDSEHRLPRAWSEHRDINEVMLATSLCPEGFLVVRAEQE
jgi:hypothetical protein